MSFLVNCSRRTSKRGHPLWIQGLNHLKLGKTKMKEIHHNSIHNAVKHLGYFHMASLKDSRYSLVLSE